MFIAIVIIILGVVFVLLPIFIAAVFFLSIVWTHRPELTVRELIREAVQEIKNDE